MAAAQAKADSSRPKYFTSAGRVVYGGGGIEPDIVIKSEKITGFTVNLIRKRLFFEYASGFAARHPDLAQNKKAFIAEFQTTDKMLQDFKALIQQKQVEFSPEAWQKDLHFIKNRIKSEIARNLWNSSMYYEVEVRNDNQVLMAMKNFSKAMELAALQSGKKLSKPWRND